MTKKFEQRVVDEIRSYNMIQSGDTVIAGVSGGMDSVCLLYILDKLSREQGFNLCVVHVNHMLRGEESERDKRFVKELCAAMDIRCIVVNADVSTIAAQEKMSIEEAGRSVRRKAFEDAAEKILGRDKRFYAKVALAHHRDDNVETVLLNLARGTGINGIKGIMPVSKQDRMTVIRPLLGVGRDEIEEYVGETHLPYVYDSTNSSDEYARNKIRLNIIPEYQRVNSRVCEHICETAAVITQINDYMNKQIDMAMCNAVDRREDSIAIVATNLRAMEPAIQTGVVYKCIGEMAGTLRDITHIHVRDVISLTEKQTGRRIELPYKLVAQRSYDNIIIRKVSDADYSRRRDYEKTPVHMAMDTHVDISLKELLNETKTFIMADGGSISFKVVDVNDSNRSALLEKNVFKKAFDYDTIKGTLILSRPKPDDEIKFQGGTKSLKKYMTDEKIPWEIRNQLLILKDLNSVVWVIGYRIGEPYKITERTTKALLVTITGGKNE